MINTRRIALAILTLSFIGFPGRATTQGVNRSRLLDQSRWAEISPDVYRVRFVTSRGPFVIRVRRAWAPWGADRFYYLVRNGFYDGTRFFRVLPGFVAQFGINGDPQIAASWKQRLFPDDTTRHQSNLQGRISFANAGPHTRNTQLFINLRNNPTLDKNYAPIGEIVEGKSVVDSLWSRYGDGPPGGRGPDQARIVAEGNQYLVREFPKLDYVKTARVVK